MKQPHNKDYFEGVLQIRGGNNELLDWIQDRIKKDGKAAITKAKKVKNGFDLYLTNQHYLQSLGRKLKQNFSGILKISQRLHTVDWVTSKHLYRVTVLFKVLPFKKGDIITFQGERIEILSIDHRAYVKNVKSGEKKDIDLEKLSRATL